MFGVSYSMLQVNILDWYQTSQWKKIVRAIILMGFTYFVDQLNDYLGTFVAGEYLLLNFLRYLINGFLIYGPFALSF
jgi:hypothetical protein